MKTILANYTAQAQSTMFDEATKKVMQSIGGMYSETERITDGHVTEMIARVRRDYETAFGANISEIKIPKDERKARKAIAELLKGSDAIFQKPLEEIKKEAEKVTIKCEPGCKKEADEVKVKCERGCKNMEDVKMG
jgi:hypothetical protein